MKLKALTVVALLGIGSFAVAGQVVLDKAPTHKLYSKCRKGQIGQHGVTPTGEMVVCSGGEVQSTKLTAAFRCSPDMSSLLMVPLVNGYSTTIIGPNKDHVSIPGDAADGGDRILTLPLNVPKGRVLACVTKATSQTADHPLEIILQGPQ